MWKPLIYHNENLGKYYEISEEGIIKNLRTEEYVNNYISGKGYYYAYLGFDGERKGINIRVHIAVAETFIPNQENKPQVCHKDGNKLNVKWVKNNPEGKGTVSVGDKEMDVIYRFGKMGQGHTLSNIQG